MADDGALLRRYTSLPALLHILRSRTLTLLSPDEWEDRNDAHFMQRYKERSKAKTVLAMCFSEASEKFHFWRVFTHGADGVCVEFDRDPLLGHFTGLSGITARKIKYKKIGSSRITVGHLRHFGAVPAGTRR